MWSWAALPLQEMKKKITTPFIWRQTPHHHMASLKKEEQLVIGLFLGNVSMYESRMPKLLQPHGERILNPWRHFGEHMVRAPFPFCLLLLPYPLL
jgi:hypothetical protein